MDNWDGNKDEWVSYLRGNVPHLTNNTNNRIESKWGKLKELIDGSLSIDQLLSTLIALQQYAKEQYLAEYHRIGSRPTRECEDEDLTRLAGHVSPFAVGLLADEHTLATGPNADYKLEHIASGNINVTSLKTGNVHEVNTRTCSCSCIFMKTCLLPCRHVMYVRSVSNFESVLPPIRFFPTRWIVQSPENNIDEGEVPTGGFRQSTCTSRPKTRGLSGGKMYCEAKAITEKIIDRMALQSTPTFRVALKWLEDFYEALNGGTVVDFAENEGKTLFPGLSQVSSVGEAGFSQLSFADLPSQRRGVSSNAAETAEGVDTCMAADASDSSEDNEDEGAVSAVTKNTKVPEYGTGATTASRSQTEDDNTERTESTPKTTRSKSTSPQEDTAAHERAKAVSWSFADRPRVNGMTKAQRKRAQAKEDSRKARVIAAIYRKGRLTRFVEFHEVAALLDGPYSFYYSKAMVDALVIPNVEVHGELSLKPYAIGQDVPRITKIPQLPVIMEAIEAIKGKEDIDLLAFWPDYGYATFDQLDAMARLIEARGRFILVMKTHKWIDETEWRVADVREPFFDMTHVTKNEHKGYVETLNLSVIRAPGEVVEGYRLLDFRENLWLHTTSILISMMVLRAQYPGVGIINPSYQDFALPDQRRRVAGGFGAADPKYDRVIGIFNISNHWVAYLINRNIDHATNKASCFMFDPMQSDHHYKIIEKSVRGGIEELLQLQDSIDYTKIEWCKQKDGTSCGVWCIAVLEMLLSNGSWDNCLYRLQPYLRMRFLHKAIAFVEKEAAIMQLPL
ncbi:hypothetical protein F442_21096 [Phytophthora nicotianae P10297]|uniref:SWIM-type domain-containing protein n=1 Tax=Phytophthora nicotianae P10297 TaxID=1317064 RepID=W2Y401_PHYNI|nr:hypothetical protein F442_21096 [Phytophthora nicotianae P10297]